VLPLEVLQHLSEVLPRRGVTLKELELSGQKLRLALELTPEVQRSALVKELQAGGWFNKVSEARDGASRGWILFETELAGQPAPAARVRPPTAAAAAPPVTAASPVSALPPGVPGAPSATAVSGSR
jgi:Tfp pilus assembly protein PilN